MEDRDFDHLTRMFAGGVSRRSVVLGVFGGVLGGLAASLGEAATASPCRNVGRRCRRDDQCCTKRCRGGARHAVCAAGCTDESTCAPGQVCCCGGPSPCTGDRGFCTDSCQLR